MGIVFAEVFYKTDSNKQFEDWPSRLFSQQLKDWSSRLSAFEEAGYFAEVDDEEENGNSPCFTFSTDALTAENDSKKIELEKQKNKLKEERIA